MIFGAPYGNSEVMTHSVLDFVSQLQAQFKYLLVQRLTQVNASLLERCKAFTQAKDDSSWEARVQTVSGVTGHVVPARRTSERTAGVFTKRRPARDWPLPRLSSQRRRLFPQPVRTQPPPPSPQHLPPKLPRTPDSIGELKHKE